MKKLVDAANKNVTKIDTSCVIKLADYLENEKQDQLALELLEKAHLKRRNDEVLLSRYL